MQGTWFGRRTGRQQCYPAVASGVDQSGAAARASTNTARGAEAREVGADCGGTNGSRPDADSIKNGELADRAQMILAGHFARATGRGRSGPTRDERSVVRGERNPTSDSATTRRCDTSAGPEDPVR
ncbi:hypothetical protein HMPREF0724_11838 [Prescottella equi ATCC 33707]|uniref:Uncharacterized protein n=1 Tax=Prescottella equi ATCC 33707 TaxID=525370 RepID=E9T0D7_RHOHA|nr:hypothetical protein HMPREF0724_11838 [Prescottella equi ATCC 33707]